MTTPRHTFRPAHRLTRQADFDRVYGGKIAKRVGPLRVHGVPGPLPHCRLGLSVSTRVGGAVQRNRVKRMLRESFRLLQHTLPGGYDLVVVVMPHTPQKLEDYQRMFADAVNKLHLHWSKRTAPEPTSDA